MVFSFFQVFLCVCGGFVWLVKVCVCVCVWGGGGGPVCVCLCLCHDRGFQYPSVKLFTSCRDFLLL